MSQATYFGYLADENYFAGCSGDFSGSASTINYDSLANILSTDTTFLTNIGNGITVGCDYEYPEGLNGEVITWDLAVSAILNNNDVNKLVE